MERYVRQSTVIAGKIPNDHASVLSRKLTDDGFTCGEHIWIAQNFAIRGVFPVREMPAPELDSRFATPEDLIAHGQAVSRHLESVAEIDFEGAAARLISHRAGHADLTQTGAEYLLHFIVPNMLFHLVTGYSILRQAGVALGKADFDGLHEYPPGFSFS